MKPLDERVRMVYNNERKNKIQENRSCSTMPVADYQTYRKMLDTAYQNHYAFPAINVFDIDFIVMKFFHFFNHFWRHALIVIFLNTINLRYVFDISKKFVLNYF